MPQSIRQVQPILEFIPPNLDMRIVQMVYFWLPFLMRVRVRSWLPSGITQVETIRGDRLVELYRQFQAGESRIIFAFRHCEVDDPLCGLYLLSRSIPAIARQQGVALQYPLYSHFMYDRGMTIWAGDWLGPLFSRMGGVPIHRGKKPDWVGLRTARELLKAGDYPLTVAPEGATNGHSERVSPLEPGVAQLGFWCVEDLHKAGQSLPVYIVPIGLQYSYPQTPWNALDRLLSELETSCGLPVQAIARSKQGNWKIYYQRLMIVSDYIITEMENFYHQTYHCRFDHENLSGLTESEQRVARLQSLLKSALQVAEEYFGVSSQGSVIDRCRRLEEASWVAIHREDKTVPLSPLSRGLADWRAEEASLRVLHMRLAESFVAVTGSYLSEKPSFERLAEMTLLVFDVLARLRGDKLPKRPRLGARSARLTVGEPMNVSDRFSGYSESRSAARQAVADLTQELYEALKNTIV